MPRRRLVAPAITITSSPCLIVACRALYRDFWSERDDLHELRRAQLARHGPEDAGADRLELVGQQHRRRCRRNGSASRRAGGSRACVRTTTASINLALLDAPRAGSRPSRSTLMMSPIVCVTTLRAAEDPDAHQAAGAAVVRGIEHCLCLNHRPPLTPPPPSSTGDAARAPSTTFHDLRFADRTAFDDRDRVARAARALPVVRHDLRRAANELAVRRVLHEPLHRDGDALSASCCSRPGRPFYGSSCRCSVSLVSALIRSRPLSAVGPGYFFTLRRSVCSVFMPRDRLAHLAVLVGLRALTGRAASCAD